MNFVPPTIATTIDAPSPRPRCSAGRRPARPPSPRRELGRLVARWKRHAPGTTEHFEAHVPVGRPPPPIHVASGRARPLPSRAPRGELVMRFTRARSWVLGGAFDRHLSDLLCGRVAAHHPISTRPRNTGQKHGPKTRLRCRGLPDEASGGRPPGRCSVSFDVAKMAVEAAMKAGADYADARTGHRRDRIAHRPQPGDGGDRPIDVHRRRRSGPRGRSLGVRGDLPAG